MEWEGGKEKGKGWLEVVYSPAQESKISGPVMMQMKFRRAGGI